MKKMVVIFMIGFLLYAMGGVGGNAAVNYQTYIPIAFKDWTSLPYGVQILPNNYVYTHNNTIYIIGEVLNNTSDVVAVSQITANFFDADGYLVGVKGGNFWPYRLSPWEKGCFDIYIDAPPNWSYYQYEPIGYFIYDRELSSGLTIFDVTGSYDPEWGNYNIIGLVRNDGNQISQMVTVGSTLYNASDIPVGCNSDEVNSGILNPGQASSFSMMFYGFDRDYGDVTYYRLRVVGLTPYPEK